MKPFALVFALLFAALPVLAQTPTQWTPDEAQKIYVQKSQTIQSQSVETLTLQHNGRIKPLDTLARETLLFLSGKRSWWGLDPIQSYLGLVVSDSGPSVAILEVRSPEVRQQLGLPKDRRHFSQNEIMGTNLQTLASPLIQKEQANSRLVTPAEKEILEVVHQLFLLQAVTSGQHFFEAVDFSFLNSSHAGSGADRPVLTQAREYLSALASGQAQSEPAAKLVATAREQEVPALFHRYMDKMNLEVFYNHARLFVWVSLFYAAIASVLLAPSLRKRVPLKVVGMALGISALLHAVGFGIRVTITGFAPVTNMYGTMLWVSFGVAAFSGLLLWLYKNHYHVGLLLLGSAAVLWLTESLPLTLSPDMDPIVAVLRNNFWLSTHVLTITLSYAAFTVTMLMGNAALIQTIRGRDTKELLRNLAHSNYRMTQLGVFLLTGGIILGGVWADYSWGRFWGWDPKETWALIADLGYLVILHARYTGWLRDFGTLAASTAAYLLVIMAWYGVNFILATGLHSYGFSSGGTTLVAIYLTLQLTLLAVALAVKAKRSPATTT